MKGLISEKRTKKRLETQRSRVPPADTAILLLTLVFYCGVPLSSVTETSGRVRGKSWTNGLFGSRPMAVNFFRKNFLQLFFFNVYKSSVTIIFTIVALVKFF